MLCVRIENYIKNKASFLLKYWPPVRLFLVSVVRRYPKLEKKVRRLRTRLSANQFRYVPYSFLGDDLIKNEQLQLLFQSVLMFCIERGVKGWWRFQHTHQFSHTHILTHLLQHYMLRRAGDCGVYIDAQLKLDALCGNSSPQASFYVQLARHYQHVTHAIDSNILFPDVPTKHASQPFLIGVSTWGEHFTTMLADYCLPSLLTEGNLIALTKKRTVYLMVHTNEAGKELLSKHSIVARIEAIGVKILYRMLDVELLKRLGEDPNHKYWHLGMVQSVDLHFAKHIVADYHLMMPDIVYASSYFSGVLSAVERGHKAIFKVAFRTQTETMKPAIEIYRNSEGVIDIPAGDLVALALKNLHPDSVSLFVTGKDIQRQMSGLHVVVMEAEEAIYAMSPHQTIVYLDHEAMLKVPQRYFVSLDSEVDKIIPADYPVYCAHKEDGLYVAEMTNANGAVPKVTEYDIDYFRMVFWANVESMDHWKFFAEDIAIPLNRSLLPDRPFMKESEIKSRFHEIREYLIAHAPRMTCAELLEALSCICNVEPSEYAVGKFAQLHACAAGLFTELDMRDAAVCHAEIRIALFIRAMRLGLVEQAFMLIPYMNAILPQKLMQWKKVYDALQSAPYESDRRVVVGCVALNELASIQCMESGLPSLLLNGNAGALNVNGAKPLLVLATFEAARARIQSAAFYSALSELMDIHFVIVPHGFIFKAGDGSNDALLADMWSQLPLVMAMKHGAHYIHMPKGACFAEGSLAVVMEQLVQMNESVAMLPIPIRREKAREMLSSNKLTVPNALHEAFSDKADALNYKIFSQKFYMCDALDTFFWPTPHGYIAHTSNPSVVAIPGSMWSKAYQPDFTSGASLNKARIISTGGGLSYTPMEDKAVLLCVVDEAKEPAGYVGHPHMVSSSLLSSIAQNQYGKSYCAREWFEVAHYYHIAHEEIPASTQYHIEKDALKQAFY